MRQTILLVLLSVACVSLPVMADHAVSPDTVRIGDDASRRPAIGIDDALAIARTHVREHKHDISHQYIDSVTLVSDPPAPLKRGRCWRIVWEHEAPHAAGGQLYIYVYMDRSTGEAFGM